MDEQLELLNVELIRMGALCEEIITEATKALQEDCSFEEAFRVVQKYADSGRVPNKSEIPLGEAAARVKQLEQDIDQKERDIETLCFRLLLRQHPVAKDLRMVSAALKMISDMERIGDQASDIVEIARYVQPGELEKSIHIQEMADATMKMVTDSIDSFVKKDLKLARKVMKDDDVVDGLFDQVKKELIGLIASDSDKGESYIDLLMIAKYFERIGDHATNIAEWVEYSITGIHVGD